MSSHDSTTPPAAASAARDRAAGDGAAADYGRNRLLAALAPEDFAALAPHLERVPLAIGAVLAEANEPLSHAYFPETGVLSLINVMADGGAVEVGTIGNEGFAGIAEVLAGGASESRTLAQIDGTALRATPGAVAAAVAERPGLARLLHRYTQAYITQVGQNAACNRLHGIEQRCARWLLMTHDRVGQHAVIPLKQEFLAVMLGVRRAGVTVAMGSLQDAGLIRYRRGAVRILDRAGLEAASCECYGIVRRHFDRLLP